MVTGHSLAHLAYFFFFWRVIRASLPAECPFRGNWARECARARSLVTPNLHRTRKLAPRRTAPSYRWFAARRNWFCFVGQDQGSPHDLSMIYLGRVSTAINDRRSRSGRIFRSSEEEQRDNNARSARDSRIPGAQGTRGYLELSRDLPPNRYDGILYGS